MAYFYHTTIKIKPLDTIELTSYSGILTYIITLKILDSENPSNSIIVRSWKGLKPLSCTPIYRENKEAKQKLEKNIEYTFQTTILDTILAEKLSRALEKTTIIRVKQGRIKIVECIERIINYTDILKEANRKENIKTITVKFKTPTQFTRKIPTYGLKPTLTLFPTPTTLVKNAYKIWSNYSTIKLKTTLNQALSYAEIALQESEYNLKTTPIPLGEGKVTVGFKGYCKYEVKYIDNLKLKDIAATLKLAEYTGIGKNRTIGLGRVRVKLN